MMTVSPRYSAGLLPGLALMIAGCESSTPAESTGPPATIQIRDGDKQAGTAASILPLPLTVLVLDRHGAPAANARVRWYAQGRGSLSDSVTLSDVGGVARVRRTLGPDAGDHETFAWLDGRDFSSVRFTSLALVQGAMTIDHYENSGQNDSVFARLQPYKVKVLDHTGAPVAGVIVNWDLIGAGALSARATPTDANGIAQVIHTLGGHPGLETVRASVNGLIGSPVSFIGLVTAGRAIAIAPAGGDGQAGLVNTELQPYAIAGSDAYGNPTADVVADWAVTSGDGLLVSVTAKSATHILGPISGPQTVTARLHGFPAAQPVTFTSMAGSVLVEVGATTAFYCYGAPVFAPADVVVPAGVVVVWRWPDSYCTDLHNVTFEDNPTPPVSSSTRLSGTFARAFGTTRTTVRYRCTRHSESFTEGEVGIVRVQ